MKYLPLLSNVKSKLFVLITNNCVRRSGFSRERI